MCGIVGYIGRESALPMLMQGLRDVSYRGYDSAGIALLDHGSLVRIRAVGELDQLEKKVRTLRTDATIGVGHTRWSTHGEPSICNAHPLTDCSGKIAVVHNGIIENFEELRNRLIHQGHVLVSQTDTEVVAHMIESAMKGTNVLFEGVQRAITSLKGAFALAVIHADHPAEIVVARFESPVSVALTDGVAYLASDPTPLLRYAKEVLILDDRQVAQVRAGEISARTFDGQIAVPKWTKVDWTQEQAQKSGFEHYMLKEIHDEPLAVRDCLRGRLREDGTVHLPELDNIASPQISQVFLVACGTASFACAFGKMLTEDIARIPVACDVGSEFRYRDIVFPPDSLVVVVSQSGETADSIACLRLAQAAGVHTVGLVNIPGSTIAREADSVILLRAGPELAVPSTKAFLAQLVVLELLAVYLGHLCGTIDIERASAVTRGLSVLPEAISQVLEDIQNVASLAEGMSRFEDAFIIGRGLDEPIAREGALKLKEVAYIHAESLPAGEFKHGPISLITPGMPVIAIATQDRLKTKTLSNLQETVARKAKPIAIVPSGTTEFEGTCDHVLEVPRISQYTDPILAAVTLQLLSYYAGVKRGCTVDHPRNLAKSVTVE
ncbi:MAG: glutamine--fructose-6-phosphate transaminase (isomerizing) [Dehalococcoidia bacterium]